MIKTINLVRLFSIILFLVIMAFAYANLPIRVDMKLLDLVHLDKNDFFYIIMGAFLIINILFWFLIKILCPAIENNYGETTAAWFSAIPFVLNIYLSILLAYIGVANNSSSVSADNFIYLNYIGPVLLAGWVSGLIYFIFLKKVSR